MDSKLSRPVWAEIDLEAVVHNFAQVKQKTEAKVMAIVKANAYGHGAIPVARALVANGADRLGVAILTEALELRASGIEVPIMIIGYTPESHASQVVENNIIQTVFTVEQAEALAAAAKKLGKNAVVHLKIDTGMSRIGFRWDSPEEVQPIFGLDGLIVEGVFTHFAVADMQNKQFTHEQLNRFKQCVDVIESKHGRIPIKHAANSAAIIDLPETYLDMVRPGIMLYGLAPSDEVDLSDIELKPAMTLKTQISMLKSLSAGTTVSYGRNYKADKIITVATLPLGYADGYSRLLSNKAEVLIKGQRARIIGRVCMDQCMVDVTHIPELSVGDEVILFGTDGNDSIRVDELADILGTINYEIVCMVSSRVPRVY
jgi:alanine racemase